MPRKPNISLTIDSDYVDRATKLITCEGAQEVSNDMLDIPHKKNCRLNKIERLGLSTQQIKTELTALAWH